MNLLLQYSGSGEILQSSTFADATTLGESLSPFRYNVQVYNNDIVVNDTNGIGYSVTLVSDSTSGNYLIFDLSPSNVLTWITNNHPESTIASFQKTGYTLHI
jgi:hypothetical protein